MIGEALDKAVEGGSVGQESGEAAEQTEIGFIFQAADESVSVGRFRMKEAT